MNKLVEKTTDGRDVLGEALKRRLEGKGGVRQPQRYPNNRCPDRIPPRSGNPLARTILEGVFD